MIRSSDESGALVAIALAAASPDEADATLVTTERKLSRFTDSRIHQNLAESSGSLTVRVILGRGQAGTATTSSLHPEEIRKSVELARTCARSAAPTPNYRGLYDANEPLAAVESFDDATARFPPLEKAERLAAMFDDGRRRGVTFAGTYATGETAIATGNSRGAGRYAATTQVDATFIAISETHSGHSSATARSIGGLDIEMLAKEAADLALLFPREIGELGAGDYSAIVAPAGIAEVFEWLNMVAFSGQSFEEGSSFLHNAIGAQLLGDNVTIADDALDPAFLPFPFDLEGVPKRRVAIIDSGVARTPLVDTLYAGRLGVVPTASCAGLGSEEHGSGLHLSLAAGTSSTEEMIAETERGVLVTRFHYINGLLDPKRALMTGMTRDGTFLIEDGRRVARLPNLRWTQSMVEAFSSVRALSAQRRATGSFWNPIGGTLAPAVHFAKWGFDPNV